MGGGAGASQKKLYEVNFSTAVRNLTHGYLHHVRESAVYCSEVYIFLVRLSPMSNLMKFQSISSKSASMNKTQTRPIWLMSRGQVPDYPFNIRKGEVPVSHKEGVVRSTAY